MSCGCGSSSPEPNSLLGPWHYKWIYAPNRLLWFQALRYSPVKSSWRDHIGHGATAHHKHACIASTFITPKQDLKITWWQWRWQGWWWWWWWWWWRQRWWGNIDDDHVGGAAKDDEDGADSVLVWWWSCDQCCKDWPKDAKVGMSFHTYPLCSVNSLHLHIVDRSSLVAAPASVEQQGGTRQPGLHRSHDSLRHRDMIDTCPHSEETSSCATQTEQVKRRLQEE